MRLPCNVPAGDTNAITITFQAINYFSYMTYDNLLSSFKRINISQIHKAKNEHQMLIQHKNNNYT
ncbi:hypothetical protein GCM10008943_12410 [Paenochrobactrum glaciei]|uniref:Uncharacterized protein n=1 Tax=Paenochrobactrum glaciei TaxID=486407 RepID=A0ABN1FVJ0_9HYPH